MRATSALCLILLPLTVAAQTAMPTDFPADATVLPVETLQERLAGKVFRARLTDGATWRLDYKVNGYMFLNTGTGYSDSGKWIVKQGQLCSEWNRTPSSCLEARATNDAVYVKRVPSGEVVALRPE